MAYDLVVFAGPLEGERFSLPPAGEMPIGRGARGIHLPDPLVSVAHARILDVDGALTIEDLSSATGTRVNDAPIPPNTRHPLEIGDVIAIGESQLRVDSAGSRVLRRLTWAMIPAWLMVFLAAAALFWVSGERPVSLTLGQAVRTPDGLTQDLIVPKAFIREHGLDVSGLALRRVTDFDRDGVDELWLYHGTDELAVTFAAGSEAGGAWPLLGRFPKGCVDREVDTFPDLMCQGITYRLLEASDRPQGRYRAVVQNEPVVWLEGEVTGLLAPPAQAAKAKAKAKADPEAPAPQAPRVVAALALNDAKGPLPYRVSLGTPDLLAGFLAARGVTRGAHYVVCEDAFPGLPAQAVIEGGEVVQLSQGCGNDLRLGGAQAPAWEGARVVAIALTAAGREALPRHLAYAWSGDPGDLFLDRAQQQQLRAMGGWPTEVVGGVVLDWKAPPHFFVPFAAEATLDDRVPLITDTPRPPDALSASLLSSGRATLDPAGCAEVTVRTGRFRCGLLRGCLPGTAFLEVIERGCGEERVLVRAGYRDGVWDGQSEALDARVELDTRGEMAVTDVIRARVGVRPRP